MNPSIVTGLLILLAVFLWVLGAVIFGKILKRGSPPLETTPAEHQYRRRLDHNFWALERNAREGAVLFLRRVLPEEDLTAVRDAIQKRGRDQWLKEYPAFHMTGGMQIRNQLRGAGYGEIPLGVDNLDDYYIPLIEAAAGYRPPRFPVDTIAA